MISLLSLLLLASPSQAADFPYQRWIAADGSRVGFRGESTIHDFEGAAKTMSVALHADLARLRESAGGEISFLVKDLDSGSADRDENMRNDLEFGRFPIISFHLDRLEGPSTGARTIAAAAAGTFSIHGVDRARTFPAMLELLPNGRLGVKGSVRFLQTEHGIEPHSTFGVVKVHDEVEVWFDLVLAPQAAALHEGTVRSVKITELTRIPGADEQRADRAGLLWLSGNAALLDTGDEWWLAQAQVATRMDPRAGLALPPAPELEAAFSEARDRLNALELRLQGLSAEQRARVGPKLTETIARLRETLTTAPAAGPASIRREGNRVEVVLGDHVWIQFEDLAGAAPLPVALSGMPELPSAVREALRTLRGVPRSAQIHLTTPAGVRELSLGFEPEAPCKIPAWALDAAQWQPNPSL